MPAFEPTADRDFDDERGMTRIIERRGNPVLAALNLFVLLLLLGAVGVLLYSEYKSGGLSAAFSFIPLPSDSPVVATLTVPDETVTPPADAPAADTTAVADTGPALEPVEPEIKVSTTPLDLADLSTTTWADPFAYCTGVGTIDEPDRRYNGPAGVPTVVAAMSAAVSAPKWRCFNGDVWACTTTGVACAKTPTVADMIAHCTKNPDARDIAAPSGTWSCKGIRPEIPLGQAWPVDARGFLPSAWVEVAAPASAVAPAG